MADHTEIRNAVDTLKNAEKQLAALESLIGPLVEKKRRYQEESAEAKATMLRLMDDGGHGELNWPDASVKLKRLPQQLGAIDESKIPQSYWIEQEPKLDRRKLLADAKEGPVDGVTLSNGGYTVQVTFRELVD